MHLAEPLDVALAFAEAWNDHDPDAIAGLFTEDADFVNVVGLWWEDRRNIRRAHARGFREMFGRSTMALERTKVRNLGDDVAVVHALWQMTGQVDPDGETAGGRQGVFVFVVEHRADRGWLAATAQNTDVVPDSETMVADEGLEPTTYVR